MSRGARELTALVRADAREVAHARQSAGLISKRCCSTRVLHVYYRSRRPDGTAWSGAYELTLGASGRRLGSVEVAFFPVPRRWSYGSATQQLEGPSYSFLITAPGRDRGWSFTASDGFLGCGEGPAADPGVCEGSSQAVGFSEAHGSVREFKRLLRQALAVARRAPQHLPISGENLFTSP